MPASRRSVFLACGIGVALIIVGSVGLPGTQEKGRDAETKAIVELLSLQRAAWNRGDVDAFLVGYWRSPELTFSGSSGVSRGWDNVLIRYQKSYPDRAAMGELEFSDLEFRFLGLDAALVLGRWHLKRESGDIGGVFTLVFEKFPDGWKIIHDHTSAVGAKQQATAPTSSKTPT